jgi:hypothetical protein
VSLRRLGGGSLRQTGAARLGLGMMSGKGEGEKEEEAGA